MSNTIILEDIKRIVIHIKKEAAKLEGKTLLISGGAGFIGSYFIATISHLNKHVFSKKCNIISIDNYITGSAKNLMNIPKDIRITHIKHNIIKPFRTNLSVDYIIHAAGIASPIYYKRSPLETIDVSTIGTRNLLELAVRKKVKSFLYFSSSEIYGDPDPAFIPTPETYKGNVSSIGPRSPYDESKRLGETLCVVYHNLHNVPVKIVRPFNIYGPGMKLTDYRVIPMFLSQGLKHHFLPIHNKGIQTRSFCYISDALIALFKVLLTGKNGEVYNVGNDEKEISITKLASKVAKMIGSNVKVKRIPYPPSYPQDDPKRRSPDITKIKKELGYTPTITLTHGLKRMLTWYKKAYKL